MSALVSVREHIESCESFVRTIAWLNRCRRLAKDWENLNRKTLAFLRLAQSASCSENFVILLDVPGQT